jgi:hypothetical protein
MSDETSSGPRQNLFGAISEVDRKRALDVFGKMLIDARDSTIKDWDSIIDGKREYAPWQRALTKFPELSGDARQLLQASLPHVVDTFMYWILSNLEANPSVRVSVEFDGRAVDNLALMSWGLPAEPTGDDGWLARFSRQRFEQPY